MPVRGNVAGSTRPSWWRRGEHRCVRFTTPTVIHIAWFTSYTSAARVCSRTPERLHSNVAVLDGRRNREVVVGEEHLAGSELISQVFTIHMPLVNIEKAYEN